MLFWVAVIGGVAVSYAALKKGFFPIWAVFFNTLISVYLGVMLLPIIAAVIPNSGTPAYFYSCSLCMLAVAVIAFVFLQVIASNYFSGGFTVSFPVIFNNIVAATLGFITGYVATSFILLVVSIMPFSAHDFVRGTLDADNLAPAVKVPVTATCDFIAKASMQIYPNVADGIIKDFAQQRRNFLGSAEKPKSPEEN